MSKSHSAICLIIHGKSANREDVRSAIHSARNMGWRVDLRVTEKPGDAQEFARRAARMECELIVAGGGDGTLNEVVNGIVIGVESHSWPGSMAIMPLGTANDFARACGIPTDPEGAMQLAVSTPPTLIDVGIANGRAFLNMATGGFGTELTAETSEELKQILGQAAYLVTALTHFDGIRPARGVFWGPEFLWEGEFLLLAVGNSRAAGGGYQLCPLAYLNDGLLDVRLLPDLPAEEVPNALGLLFGDGLDAVTTVIGAAVTKLYVESEEPIQINLDGEPITSNRFRFELLPRRLPIILPPLCPLIGNR